MKPGAMPSLLRLWQRLLTWRVIAALAVVALLVWLAGRALPDGRLHVYFLDVGQGDAIFVQASSGQQILVDGGPSPTGLLEQLGEVMPFWDRSLDVVVLTHPDADHLTGLLPVLERYRVGTIVEAPPPENGPQTALFAAWRERVVRSGAVEALAQPGQRLLAGRAVLTVLHSGAGGLAGPVKAAADDNNRSLVLRLDYGANSFLLTGDAEAEAEASMLRAGLPLRASVLKVAHHGSRRSSTASFVASVAPHLAVVQVGASNRFGHPDPETLARLSPAQVLRTDRRGRIEVIGDGEQLWVKTTK